MFILYFVWLTQQDDCNLDPAPTVLDVPFLDASQTCLTTPIVHRNVLVEEGIVCRQHP